MQKKYKIKLQPGDHCRRDMGEEKYREVAGRFFGDGCTGGEGVGSYKAKCYFGWDGDDDVGLYHSDYSGEDYAFNGRLLTYEQVMEIEDPEQDNGWLTSVDGLPPAGTECEVLNPNLDNAAWEKCKILFMGKFVCVYESESCKERVANHDLYNVQFRPIKSEREKAIDAAFKVFDEKSHIYPPIEQKFLNEFISSLYDAGMLKIPD